MPIAVQRICRAAGCGRTTAASSGYCAAHRGHADRLRGQTTQQSEVDRFRSSAAWRHRFVPYFVARHPICCDPFREHGADDPRPTQQVHHVIGLAEDMSLALDEDNCRPLCNGCHGRINRMERAREPTKHLFPPETGPYGSEIDGSTPPGGMEKSSGDAVRPTAGSPQNARGFDPHHPSETVTQSLNS